MIETFTKGKFLISTDRRLLNKKLIYDFLSHSYWAKDRTKEKVFESIKGSVCFGIYDGNEQVGFARVITDKAVFAYLADVFILESHRGKGLSKWLIDVIINKSSLKKIKSWNLATADAHKLYERYGFKIIAEPGKFMEMKKV
jgi:GNAT superfamily N-acetyltransferase